MDFLKILKELTAAQNLEFSDICVMAVLVTYGQYNKDQTVDMSVSEIHAEFPRISQKTIRRSLQRLADNHYISIIRAQAPARNKYKVLIPIPQPEATSTRRQHKKQTNLDIDKYKIGINNI